MKFTTSKSTLAHAIGTVQKAVSPRSPLPILSGVLFKAHGDQLTVTGSDTELTIQCTVNVETEREGSIVLPIKYIADLVRYLPDVPIQFHTLPESTSTTIIYGVSQINIHGFEPEQYPRLPAVEKGASLSLAQDVLKDMLRQVLFAVSNDETRPIFTGVLMQVEEGQLRLVATDTYRLAVRRFQLEREPEQQINVVIPGKTLNEVARLIGGDEEEITIVCGENHVFFLTGTLKIASRLIAGQFPPYEQVIPREFVTRARLATREILEATERASLLVRDGHPAVQFSLQEDGCVVSVQTQAGWIREEVSGAVEGEPLEIWFNARYMGESLRALGSEELSLELTGPLSAAVLRPAGEENYLSLLLPAKPPKE
ncbi:DNA polymerase III subunit beta [Desulfofundulus salinus]|uniref:Beta sliding clamp n=1 Tax=Desulfofundulus salinus TaxID=2419843 RepID=A0A494WQT6_9FIRM|nr:DNA polymerase III subunit beta [Desulfofundulus salinum]RKO65509.1 DNA polymerase III subunit beta [Desulfofundulus salinum]